MPVTYTNRKGVIYYLCQGRSKTGKPRYYFARELKGEPLEAIPQGWKIQESPNGIVSLVRDRPAQIRPELEGVATGDSIAMTGQPSFEFSARPEIPGGIATVALAVNMVAHVMNAAPGLRTMAELPVPAAVVGDVRRRLRVPLEAATRG